MLSSLYTTLTSKDTEFELECKAEAPSNIYKSKKDSQVKKSLTSI